MYKLSIYRYKPANSSKPIYKSKGNYNRIDLVVQLIRTGIFQLELMRPNLDNSVTYNYK